MVNIRLQYSYSVCTSFFFSVNCRCLEEIKALVTGRADDRLSNQQGSTKVGEPTGGCGRGFVDIIFEELGTEIILYVCMVALED